MQVVHEPKMSSNKNTNTCTHFDVIFQVGEEESKVIRVMVNKGDISKRQLK